MASNSWRTIVIGLILAGALVACGGAPARETELVTSFDGDRPLVTPYFELSAGTVEYRWYYAGAEFSNFCVYMQDKDGQYYDMPINEAISDEARISGTASVRVTEPGRYRLLIDLAEGDWSIMVRQQAPPDSSPIAAASAPPEPTHTEVPRSTASPEQTETVRPQRTPVGDLAFSTQDTCRFYGVASDPFQLEAGEAVFTWQMQPPGGTISLLLYRWPDDGGDTYVGCLADHDPDQGEATITLERGSYQLLTMCEDASYSVRILQ